MRAEILQSSNGAWNLRWSHLRHLHRWTCNSNDAEDFPFRRRRFHEYHARCPANRADHQQHAKNQDADYYGEIDNWRFERIRPRSCFKVRKGDFWIWKALEFWSQTTLGEICEFIHEVHNADESFLLLKLDTKRVRLPKMRVTVESIKHSIAISSLKLKLGQIIAHGESILTIHSSTYNDSGTGWKLATATCLQKKQG